MHVIVGGRHGIGTVLYGMEWGMVFGIGFAVLGIQYRVRDSILGIGYARGHFCGGHDIMHGPWIEVWSG